LRNRTREYAYVGAQARVIWRTAHQRGFHRKQLGTCWVAWIPGMPNDSRRDLDNRGECGKWEWGELEMRVAKIVLRLDQSVADGVDGGFAAGHDIELEEDTADMLRGGAWADEEALGNLPVRAAVYEQAQHVQFTW
jgi:hypothetical protein